ncbi:MAG: prenyltransferase/squalene oxidase repeat-containing protein [Candidatus Thorarchaeota archaeon]
MTRTNRIAHVFYVAMALGLVVFAACGAVVALETPSAGRSSLVGATTRRQAIVNYIEALYISNEGTFYSYLRDWPTDPRINSFHTLIHLQEPLWALIVLGAEGSFDMSNASAFAISHLNRADMLDRFGPVNFSRRTPCSVIACRIAVELFAQLRLSNLLRPEWVSEYILRCQGPLGGFRGDTESPIGDESLIPTQAALYTMHFLDRMSLLNREAVLSFVMSCHSGGGFAYTPGAEPDTSALPLALMCLDYLGALDRIDRDKTVALVLSEWDNSKGCALDGTIVSTERLVWSLFLLDALDRIDIEAVTRWVLARQSSAHGEFLPRDGAPLSSERFEWTRAAIHILQMLDRLDALEQEFQVLMKPVHVIPQEYYDLIEKEFGGPDAGTDTVPPFVFPRIDIVKIITDFGPVSFLLFMILLPALYWYNSERNYKRARSEMRKRRRPGR